MHVITLSTHGGDGERRRFEVYYSHLCYNYLRRFTERFEGSSSPIKDSACAHARHR